MDKRTNQFFQLTERNIAGIHLQANTYLDNNSATDVRARRRGLRLGLLLILALVGMMIIWSSKKIGALEPMNIDASQSLPAPTVILTSVEPRLTSFIPAFHAGAKHQILQVALLRKADLYGLNDDDTQLNGMMVVMDKVIVIPKIIALNAKERERA